MPVTPDRRQFSTAAAAATCLWQDIVRAASAGKRIGFVDNHLDNFHVRTYLRILREDLREQGFQISGAFALQAAASRTWAAENDLPYFASVAQLNEAVDFFAVLAPLTPELHRELCTKVFPFGKPTFVDKTFAPDAATARELFNLADKHETAVQTSSALRYTAVQQYVEQAGRDSIRHVVSWGGGRSFDEYVVHPLELAVSCLGHEVTAVMRRGEEPQSQLLLDFSRGRTAVVNLYANTRTPYAAAVSTDKETKYIPVDTRKLFVDAAQGLIDFFAAGRPLIDRRQTMAIMRVIDAARDPKSRDGFVSV